MSKIENLKLNFTESDIHEMLDNHPHDETQTNIFEWRFETEEGTTINVTVTVGNDECDEEGNH